MIAYSPEAWTEFFLGGAGAAAALAGLLIVALSVNIKEIIRLPGIPTQAGATLGILVLALVSCTLAMIPHQSTTALGIEILIFGIPAWLLQIKASHQFATLNPVKFSPRAILPIILGGQAQALPFIIGGISLITEFGGGLYWIAAGIAIAFTLSILSAWVWLIEVRR